MTDHAPFLATIIANPADDRPRLVLADELEAIGDQRGEFIRVQVELAKMKAQHVRDCTGTITREIEAGPLRRRERELLEARGIDWIPKAGLPNKVHHALTSPQTISVMSDEQKAAYEFRRGFVESVALSWVDWGGEACQRCEGRGTIATTFDATRRSDAEPRRVEGLHEWCKTCNRTGRTPGHAAAIIVATPLRKVRLTTMPEVEYGLRGCRLAGREKWILPYREHQDRSLAALLTAEWPGIEFELPATITLNQQIAEQVRSHIESLGIPIRTLSR